MTREEFNNIKWEYYCHSTGGGCFETVRKAVGYDTLFKFSIVPHDEWMIPEGHGHTIYEYNGKDYHTVNALLKAMEGKE